MDIDDLARQTIARQHAEIEKLQARIDAAIKVLSDDRFPHVSRVNDARSILAY